MTEGNQGPSHLAPHSFDADHPAPMVYLLGNAVGCRRQLYVAGWALVDDHTPDLARMIVSFAGASAAFCSVGSPSSPMTVVAPKEGVASGLQYRIRDVVRS